MIKKQNIVIGTVFIFLILILSLILFNGGQPNVHKNSDHKHDIDLTTLNTINEIALNPANIPKPIIRNYSETIKIDLITTEVISEIEENKSFVYWTYNNTLPGPFLRVREGDTVELTLTNDKSSQFHHSIDLHAVTGPGGGAVLTQVGAGESKTIKFKALNPGLYVYHCATPDVPHHVANGMYGLILVEPKEGLSQVDKEFYVMQGELYLGDKYDHTNEDIYEFNEQKMLDENPDYIVFNGRVGALLDNPIKADVNETVRLFVGNGGVTKISSFHVIGEIFDKVFPEAATNMYLENVQTTLVPAGGATITEFKLDVPGNFILVDHALARLQKGASGLMQVSGEENPNVYSAIYEE